MNEDYVCNDGIKCYDKWDKCDGTNECEDGTDELGCPVKCKLFTSGHSAPRTRNIGNKFNNWPQSYCMKLVEGSFEVDFNSSHDGEKNILKTIIFRVRSPNITFGQICRNLAFCQILSNFALLFYTLLIINIQE